MSKVKKGLSLLLTALMVMSVLPVSAFGAKVDGHTVYGTSETDKFTYAAGSVTDPVDFWVDTEGTTETIRLADGDSGNSMFAITNPKTVVAATPSGIPSVPEKITVGTAQLNTFYKFAYAGETPSSPVVKLTIHGINDPSLIRGIDFVADRMTIESKQQLTTTTTADSMTFSWMITKATVDAGPGTNIVYGISFNYNGVPYTQYAHAHAETVARPAGVSLYATRDQDANGARFSTLNLVLSANSKSSFASATVGKTRAYVDYTSTSLHDYSGNWATLDRNKTRALYGMDLDWDGTSGILVKDNSKGSVLYMFREKGNGTTGYSNAGAFGTDATDGNRAITTVWIDKYNEHLGKGNNGTSYDGNANANGLNLRFVQKVGEFKQFYSYYNYRMTLGDSSSNYTDCVDQAQVTSKPNTNGVGSKVALNVDFQYTSTNGNTNCANILARGCNDEGTGGFLDDYAISPEIDANIGNSYLLTPFGGVGPDSSQSKSSGYTIGWSGVGLNGGKRLSDNGITANNFEDKYRITYGACITLQFRTYDTGELRQLITAIDRNTGVSNGSELVRKGINPQSWKYTSGWDDFITAYNAAKALLVDFTCGNVAATGPLTGTGSEQSNLEAAYNTLKAAYLNLNYAETGKIVVHHYFNGTNIALIPDQVITYPNTNNTAIKNGARFVVNAATIKGYVKPSVNSFQGSAIFNEDGGKIYNDQWTVVSTTSNAGEARVEYTFYYTAEPQNLIVQPGNGRGYTPDDPTVKPVIRQNVYMLDDKPDFADIRSEINKNDAWEFEKYYKLDGLYMDSAYANKVDEANYTMTLPAEGESAIMMYAKWNPKAVQFNIIAVDGETGNVIGTKNADQTATPTLKSSTPADDNLNDVTFTIPATPSISNLPAGSEFLQYYADAECTKAILTSTISASYADEAEYPIIVGTGDTNSINIYAKYATMTDKIYYEPNGGQLPGVGEYANYTKNTDITTVIPTRDGYNFTGWRVEGGSVKVGGATKSVIAPTDTTFQIPDDNGRKLYAQWENKDITITFDLNFTPEDGDKFSSNNQPGKSYYWQTTADDNVKADTPVDGSVFPSDPRRYGYSFNGWRYQNKSFDMNGKYPTGDFTLVASWKAVDNVAFAAITAVEKESGSEIDVEKKPVESETVKVARGDVVTMKVYIRGNFKAGSSSFIFFYDGDFYEQIDGIEIVDLNEANGYISGIKAVKYDDGAYRNSAALRTYLESHGQTINNVVPGTNTAVSNLQMFQVAIDPDLDELTPNENGFYEAASLNSEEYMFEIRLKVSDTATGTGSLWLPTELVRSADNRLGETFIANSTDGTLAKVQTSEIKFDTDIIFSSTVVDTELSNPESTITVKLPTKGGQVLGNFKYLDGSSKVYTGPYGEEILEVYNKDANGNLVDEDGNIIEHDEYDVTNYAKYGFPGVEREGYTAGGWFKVNNPAEDYDAANHYDTSDEWAVGYYGTEEQDGNTYEVKWEPIDCTLTFTKDGTAKEYVKKYDEVLTSCPASTAGSLSYQFIGYIPVGEEAKEENIVDFTNYVVKGDAEFYAWTIPAQKTVKLNLVDDSATSTALGSISLDTDAQAAIGVELRVGDVVKIVEAVPATPEEGVKYITADVINGFANGTFTSGDYTATAGLGKSYVGNYAVKVSALPKEFTIGSLTNNVDVVFEGAIVNVTFDAGDGTFSNGESTKVISGRYGDTYDIAPISADVVAPFGYKFNRWNPTSDQGKYLTKSYTARYDAATVNIHYLNEGMTAELTGMYPDTIIYDEPDSIANVPAKTGYTGEWILVEPKNGGYSAITGSTALSGNYFTPSADSVTVTTSDSGKSYDVYFAPVYTAKEYNVYYNINGVVDSSLSAKVTFGTNYNLAALGTAATGYEIKGWYTNAACTEPETPLAAGSQQTMGSANITYYAKTAAKEYDVNFWNNDGTDAKSTVKVTFAQSIDAKKPANPTREGYTFVGWSFNDKATAGETLGSLSTEGADVYAVWQVNNYTVTYISMGGSVVAPAYYDYGETIVKPADPTRTGYTFDKWVYADGENEGEKFVFEGATMPSHNINLKADWAINTHTYKFFDGETELTEKAITKNYGEAVTEPTYSKEGYTFKGWSPAVPTTMGDEDLEFTAVVEINQYTVTYDSDGGSAVAAQTSNYGTAIVKPADPTKTGYTFDKWVYVEDGVEGDEVDFTTATIPAKDITIKAKWTINEYTITFNSDGGSDVAKQTYDYNANLAAPTAPTKTGYTFSKWVYADGENAGSEFVFDGAKMPANDIALKALWTANEQTYIFYEEIGETQTELFRITKKYDQAIEASEYYRASNYKTGYIFSGWSPEVPATMGLSTSFKANLTKEQYTISFNTDGGNTIEAVQPSYGDVITLQTPVKEGYTFTGWSYNGSPVDYNRDTMKYTVPDFGDSEQEKNNVQFVAGWSKNSYNFIFVDEDNEELDRKSIAYNDVIDADVTAPKKAGYSFENWLYADKTVVKLGEDLMPAKDVTVTPKYKQHDYKLVYVLNNGEEPAEGGTVHAGENVTLRTGDEYTGHTFDGWYTDEDCTMSAGETKFLVPAQTLDGATITLYAKWKINEYKLTVVSDTDDVDETMVKYGTPIAKLDDLEKDGYEFKGWKLGSADGDAVVWEGLTMPAEDLTIVAKWAVNKYFVTFYYNNGEDDLDTEYDFGAEVTMPETDPVKEGHTFSGWTLDGEKVEWPVTVPDYDIEIEATWTPEVYTLAFDANLDGVTDPNSFDATYDTVVNLPELSKEGYVFEGWQLKKDGEGDGQAEIYASGKYLVEDLGDNGDTANFEAVWTANEYKVIFNPNGGAWGGKSTDIIVKKQDCGTAIEVPEEPTRTGYKFVGYKIEETEEIVQDLPTVMGVTPKLGLIYTAQWDAYTVPVKFYLDIDKNMTADNAATMAADIIADSSAYVMMDTAEFDSEYTVPSYAYGDEVVSTWYDAEGNAYNAGDKITISQLQAIKLAASATQLTTEESHKAIFNPMGGIWADETTANKEYDVVVNTLITAPEDPTKAGYTFLGWTPEVGVMKGEDIEFKATWEIIPYSVTFYIDEADTTGETFTDLYYGNEIEFPADPEKDGYEFTGWYYATNVSGEITKTTTPAAYGDTMPQNDVYIIGTWVATVRYVTFYAYDTDPLTDEYSAITGEGIVNPVEVQAGAAFNAIGAIAAPEYANFTFAGWFDSTGAQWVEGTTVNENISLYAKYDRVAVKLVPASETSTAMIERNGVVETWNTLADGTTINGVTSVIEPNMNAYETPADFETYYVYGLVTDLTADMLDEYIKVQGDGYYDLTLSATNGVGTGAVVNVYDNVTDALIETFYIIVFGDLDGDAAISSTDTALLKKEIKDQVWAVEETKVPYLVKAIDLDGDGSVSSTDTSLEKTAVKELGLTINQITGKGF